MSNYLIKGETLTNIANAIRTKTGKTDSIPTENMATEISDLPIYPLYDGAVEEIRLSFILNSDKASYSVSGIGNVTDTDIRIPANYKELPVTRFSMNLSRIPSVASVTLRSNINSFSYNSFGIFNSDLKSIYYWGNLSQWCLCEHRDTNGDSGAWDSNGVRSVYIQGKKIEGDIIIPENTPYVNAASFRGCQTITSVTFPDSVTSIKQSAFYNNTNLSSVVFSKNSQCDSILNNAFQYCRQLKNVWLPTTPPSIEYYSFYEINASCVFHVPAGSLSAYQSATNWSALTSTYSFVEDA